VAVSMANPTGVDQLAVLLSGLAGTVSVALPAQRPVDPVTLAHLRAVDRVHGVAGWLMRGADLRIVLRNTPFWVETVQELWEYYEALPLDKRVDVVVGVLVAGEVLGASGVTRERCPRMRRALDVYSAAVAVACLVPRSFFYYVHRTAWSFAAARASREACEPSAPLLLSAATREQMTEAASSAAALVSSGSLTLSKAAMGTGSGGRSRWATAGVALFCTSAACAGALWVMGPVGRESAFLHARRKWLQVRDDVVRWLNKIMSAQGERQHPAVEAQPPQAPEHAPHEHTPQLPYFQGQVGQAGYDPSPAALASQLHALMDPAHWAAAAPAVQQAPVQQQQQQQNTGWTQPVQWTAQTPQQYAPQQYASQHPSQQHRHQAPQAPFRLHPHQQ